MECTRILTSNEDASVNFVFDNGQEARFVQRSPEYFIAYLSSQGGCNKACRFCHLTQTKQTLMVDTTLAEFNQQAMSVLTHYKKGINLDSSHEAETVHFNFMARGEALANYVVCSIPQVLFDQLSQMAGYCDLKSVFNISTIMPRELTASLSGRFKHVKERHSFYYSLYSVREAFRSRWLPNAMVPWQALEELKAWQLETGNPLVFHWPFIKGENDSLEDVEKILELITPFKFQAKFNCVRYNPYSPAQGEESDQEIIERNFALITKEMSLPGSRIVPRVGKDVKASCGMFVETAMEKSTWPIKKLVR